MYRRREKYKKNKIFFWILSVLALFFILGCGKSIKEIGEEDILKAEKIDFTALTFNEAQEKLISEYSRDAIPEETSIRSKYYTLVTKDGEIGKRKNFIVDTKSKKTFSGRILHEGKHSNTRVEELVKNRNIVALLLYFPQGKTRSDYISIEQTLDYLII